MQFDSTDSRLVVHPDALKLPVLHRVRFPDVSDDDDSMSILGVARRDHLGPVFAGWGPQRGTV